MTELRWVSCTLEQHGAAILEIFNHAIRTSTALYDYEERKPESMIAWFAIKVAGGFPVIGVENESGKLLGFASYGVFRPHPAYKYAVEHSVYVHHEHRGQGLGRQLVERVVEAARSQGKHAIIGAIDAENDASIGLHESLGFERVGTLPQVGFKFGRWLDLALLQLTLGTPTNPVDGN